MQPSSLKEKQPRHPKSPLYQFDLSFFKRFERIAGVDEAGRGPLAGPVVACACVIEKSLFFPGINDSKQLTPKKREEFFHILTEHPEVSYGIGVVDHLTIDSINIYQASLLAMKRALEQLTHLPELLLVDGMKLEWQNVPFEKVIGGDGKSQLIAAASILAKVTRDRMMVEYHKLYPHWGFDRHKGYPTPAHIETLKEHGPSPIHRLTFQHVPARAPST